MLSLIVLSFLLARDNCLALPPRKGLYGNILGAGEQVLVVESKGRTGFVQTNTRLLGFSGKLQRWSFINLPTSERILKWTVTPRMVIASGQQAVYGYQSDQGRWKQEPWGAGESLQESVVKNAIGVLVTGRRALGFSAVTGGFFSQDLPVGNQEPEIQSNDHVVILRLSNSMFVFRSGLGIWAELP